LGLEGCVEGKSGKTRGEGALLPCDDLQMYVLVHFADFRDFRLKTSASN